jgi:hypothetical protein
VDVGGLASVANACHQAKMIKKCAVYFNRPRVLAIFQQRFAICLINVVAFMLVWLFHATFFKAKFLYSLVVESVLFTPKLVVANANSNR